MGLNRQRGAGPGRGRKPVGERRIPENLAARPELGEPAAPAARSLWSLFWAVVVPISTIAASVATAPGVPESIRAPLVTWFLGICPGMAVVHQLRLGKPITEIALAVGLSLALSSLVPSVFLYLGAWSPSWTFAVLVGIAAIGSLLDLATLARWVIVRLQSRSKQPADVVPDSDPGMPQEPDRLGAFARHLGAASPEDAADASLHVAVDRVVGDLADRPRGGD